MKLLDEPVACLKRFEISSRGYLGAHFEARAHVLTVLGRVSGKPRKSSLGRPSLREDCAGGFRGDERLGSFLPRKKMGSSRRAASAAVRANGPTKSRCCESGATPSAETRPRPGFRPTIPQSEAGMRIDPPVSVPMLP